jgi:hypothetical protein
MNSYDVPEEQMRIEICNRGQAGTKHQTELTEKEIEYGYII